jgi:outer membrane lipoprotein-sorting protein
VFALLRRISTRRLVATCAAAVAIGAGGAAIALAATGGGPTPPPKDLPVAIHDALTAPKVDGVTARIKFTNHLISGSDVRGGSPLLNGASGRLWASSDGHLRLELQADASSEGATSDSQIISDGHTVTVYDSGTDTVYKADLPKGRGRDSDTDTQDQPPSVAEIQKDLNRLMEHVDVSGAQPSDIAGQPAYTVRVEPKRNGGLVGGAELAWDAVHGTPLRVAVYAKGDSSPVVQLEVTDISYGPVDSSVFDVSPPAGAKVTDLTARQAGRSSTQGESRDAAPVTGVQQVQQAVPFQLSAPDSLAGLQRSEVRLIHSGEHPAALVTYGRGLAGIAVIEAAADSQGGSQNSAGGDQGGPSLPTVSVNGAQGRELDTPLGTVIDFQRAGVEYTVIGSVDSGTAMAAAQGL